MRMLAHYKKPAGSMLESPSTHTRTHPRSHAHEHARTHARIAMALLRPTCNLKFADSSETHRITAKVFEPKLDTIRKEWLRISQAYRYVCSQGLKHR